MELEKKRRLPSVDRLPEHIHYQDSGCTVSPSCLSCPLEQCIFDEPIGGRDAAQQTRDEAIFLRYCAMAEQARRGGQASYKAPDVRSLATDFNVSRRTIHRVVQRMRQREGDRSHENIDGER